MNDVKAILFGTFLSGMIPLVSAQDNTINGFVAFGAITGAEYEGSENYEINPAAVVRVQYKHYFLQTEGLGAKLNVSPIEYFEFGPTVNYRTGRDNDIENSAVSRIDEIDDAIEGGVFIRVGRKNVLMSTDELSFEIKAYTDVSNTYDGAVVALGPEYGYQANSQLFFNVSIDTTYADSRYMENYFGVNANNIGTSDLPYFRAGSGIKDIGASLMVFYQFNKRWGVNGVAEYNKLLGDAKDSPLVRQEGNSDQYMILVGVNYRF